MQTLPPVEMHDPSSRRGAIRVRPLSGPREHQRGLTLIEIMVGMMVGVVLTAAAVSFVRSESRLMGVTQDRLDVVRASRVVMNLISSDLRSAGLGLRPTGGNFDGLLSGTFTLAGVTFNNPGFTVSLEEDEGTGSVNVYNVATQDLGVRLADGDQATIIDFTGKGSNAGRLTICDHGGMMMRDNELILLQDQPSISTWAIQLTPFDPNVPCGDCAGGCRSANWALPASTAHQYEGNNGDLQDYTRGQMFGGYKTIVWFMTQDPNRANRGVLRRMTYDDTQPDCGARDNTCGALVVSNVEGFFYRVYQFAAASGWQEVLPGTQATADGRVRVDVELIVRSDERADKTSPGVVGTLAPGGGIVFPGGGASGGPLNRDRVERRVFRTTVELKNSGRI